MSLDAILEDDKTPVTGDNTALVISTESYAQPVVTPAQLDLLKRIDAFKESKRVFDGLESVDKAFAVEAMAAFFTQDPRIAAKLTASPSVANRQRLSDRYIQEAEVLAEQTKVLITDLQITAHNLVNQLAAKQPVLDIYREKLKALIDQFVDKSYISNQAVAVHRGTSYELYSATPLRTIAYRIDDTAIMYPPFEGKLCAMAAEVVIQLEQREDALAELSLMPTESVSLREVLEQVSDRLSTPGTFLRTVIDSSPETTDVNLHYYIAALTSAKQLLYLVEDGQPLMDAAIRFSELLLNRA